MAFVTLLLTAGLLCIAAKSRVPDTRKRGGENMYRPPLPPPSRRRYIAAALDDTVLQYEHRRRS